VKRYVYAKNAQLKKEFKYTAVENGDTTTVLLILRVGELPPYEFTNEYGIMAMLSRRDTVRSARAGEQTTALGVRPLAPKRTQSQIIAIMSPEERQANLPWWHDPKNGQLLVNTRLIKDPEALMFHENKFRPNPETPYPSHYNLDDNLRLKTREQQFDEEDEEDYGEGYDVN